MAFVGSLGEMSVSFSADISRLSSGIGQAKSQISGFSAETERSAGGISGAFGGIMGFVAGAAMEVGKAAIGAGIASVKLAGDFQESMDKVQAYAGLTKQATEDMGQSILKLAPALGQTPKALADGFYSVASAGFKGADGLKVLTEAGMTASAANVDSTLTTHALVGSLNALGLGAKDSGNIMDELNATVKNGLLSWDTYGTAVSKLAGVISATGESSSMMQRNFTDSNAAIDVFTNADWSAAKSSTYLGNTLNLLENKTDTVAKNASALGLSFDETKFKSMDLTAQMAYLGDITDHNSGLMIKLAGGNSIAATTIDFLDAHSKSYADTIASITSLMKNGATTQDMFNVAQAGFNFQVSKVKASLDAVGISLGTKLLPLLSGLMQLVTPLIQRFADWTSSSSGLGSMLQQVGDIFKYLQTTFAGIDIKPVAAAFASLGDSLSAVGTAFGGVLTNIMPVVDGFDPLTKDIQSLVSGGLAQVTGFMQTLSLAFENLSVQIQTGTGMIGTLEGAFAAIRPTIQQVGDLLGGVLSEHIKTLTAMGTSLSNWWTGTMTPALQAALPSFEALGSTILTKLVPAIVTLYADLQSVVDHVMPDLLAIFEAVAPVFVRVEAIFAQGLSGALQYFIPFALQAGKAITDFASAIADRVVPIVQNFGHNVTAMLDFLAPIWNAVWPAMYTVLNGVWQEIVGAVEIAWGLVKGIVLIGLDILGNNWGAAWTDMLNMLIDVWNGMVQVIGGALAMAGIHIGTFGHVASITMANASTNASNSMKTMASNVNNSTSSMKDQSYSNVSAFSNDTMAMFQRMGAYGTQQMASLDANTIGYWNDIAGYINSHPINAVVNTIVNGAGAQLSLGLQKNAYASGVMNAPAGWAIVGEYGPELMKMHGGETVLPHNTYPSNAGAGGVGGAAYPSHAGGGQPVIHVHNDNRVYLDGQQMADIIAPRIVSQMQLRAAVRQ